MAFAPSRSKRHKTFVHEELNLTSMMDAMTIILLFLLKTFSTSSAIVSPSSDLQLPYSASIQAPHDELTVSVTRENILVANKKIMSLSELNPQETRIEPLYKELARRANEAKRNEREFGIPFTNEVMIQADKEVPFQTLFKVIYTCGSSEFNKLRLLTIREK